MFHQQEEAQHAHGMTPEAFIKRWNGMAGSERSNYQLFVIELCELLDLDRPTPAGQVHADNTYVFERHLKEHDPDAKAFNRFIDCYRRGSFVLEAKSVQQNRESQGAQIALRGAHSQAQNYARSLPAEEGRPPFILVVDVGNVIQVFSEFSRTGGNYLPFPNPNSNRIRITDLARPEVRDLLRHIWLDPMSLDPSQISARVTREISAELAELARSLEQDGHDSHAVAGFLTRSLFTMFAEDVELLPRHSFTELLESIKDSPDVFVGMVEDLWQRMNTGGFSAVLKRKLPRFNGKFFHEPTVLPLNTDQIRLLLRAAHASWEQVEPAIFGSLLERALNPTERHALGAHYTPRAYVERLVLPTVIEPLREEWQNVQAAALQLHKEGKVKEAQAEVRQYHNRLLNVRVLDPACGSANFLYMAMEHMKRLEGEVLAMLHDFGASGSLETQGLTVDPHQFLGIEVNPRAAAIAELVLWIGYLQWHFRTNGNANPPEPVLRDFHNIECRDAVLAWDKRIQALDEQGRAITRWDGVTRKPHPITGELVPDDTFRVPVWKYINPRPAEWPLADFIVGNPPFIGKLNMRSLLGDGYVEALRGSWPEIPDSANFVMYWWHTAAEKVRAGLAKNFGLITTNNISQIFNRRVVQVHMEAESPLSLIFAIPDHPWVDTSDGAQVRIAMTVGSLDTKNGRLVRVISESDNDQDEVKVILREQTGKIFSNLRIGANVADTQKLIANANITSMGVMLAGSGFIVTPEQADSIGLGHVPGLEKHIREYRNGRDLADRPRGVLVLDFFGLTAHEVREQYPGAYQWLINHVKPERDSNRDKGFRENWWLFGRPRPALRVMTGGLLRYIATGETAKHRFFQFLSSAVLPDHMIIAIGDDDAFHLGVLSSRVHIAWALVAGARLGVGNDPRYNKSRCFETFPFPETTEEQKVAIRQIAEQLDAHRKRQQEAFSDLTMTGMYNVLEKLRSGEKLNTKDLVIHEHGLISVLRDLHDELDSAVFTAYGWEDLAGHLVGRPGATTPLPDKTEEHAEAEEELLQRLVNLNSARLQEESQGVTRWLRPEFQSQTKAPEQGELETSTEEAVVVPTAATTPAIRIAWPTELPAQMAAIAKVLAGANGPLTEAALAGRFTGKGQWKKRLPQLLETLVALGRTRFENGSYLSN